MSNNNPHNLTFPYPLIGSAVRPPGVGCLSCMRQGYCPAVYWFKRYTDQSLSDKHGTACSSWSNNPADKKSPVNQPDLDENEYIYNQRIGSEANRNGINAGPTGNDGKF